MIRFFVSCLLLSVNVLAIENGQLNLGTADLSPGKNISLNGQWLYRPGYDVAKNEAPEKFADGKKLFSVPVPQLLSRIRWWLDDSEDFNRYETNRLKQLGFDTDRAEDGWYYLHLNLPSLKKNLNLALEFDGVAMRSKAFCNGKLLGAHDGMFSRFSYDLTPNLKKGNNLIAVFVSMEKIPATATPMGEAVTVNLTASKVRSMSKGMFGPFSSGFENRAYDLHGIWQPVKLVVRSAAKLDDVWFSPKLDGGELRVEAHSLVGSNSLSPRRTSGERAGERGDHKKETPLPGPLLTPSSRGEGEMHSAYLRARWVDPRSKKVFAELPRAKIQLSTSSVSQTLTLKNVAPKLWTPAEPNLYRLDVTLESSDGKILDSWTHNVGFRTFEARGNQFFLNGKPYWLRGANHLPYGKNPFDPNLARKLIQSLHDANVRITRTHATPWNEAWLDAADQIGLAVSLEGIRPWALAGKIGATPPELFEHWLMENEDVVKRARNHPSVFIYTVGNEMLLREAKNLEKWQQLSDVVKQTRKIDPTRPVICSSDYVRDPEFYKESLKPAGLDDGDADDIHAYNNWYGPSSFTTDAKLDKEVKGNAGHRPLMGQEMSTGYPDLDNGLPVLRYTRDLLTPQAWIGNLAYPGNDPIFFLDHHRAVTKRWAERLRFERGNNTAGFMLFAAECWFSHSYDAAKVTPYSVVEAVREAFSPVGLALETGRRRFCSGEQIDTAVFVTNDSEQQENFSDLQIKVELLADETSGTNLDTEKPVPLAALNYMETARLPVQIKLPVVTSRSGFSIRVKLMKGDKEISRTTDCIEILASEKPLQLNVAAFTRNVKTNFNRFLQTTAHFASMVEPKDAKVLLLGPGDDFVGLEKNGGLRSVVEGGATAIVFSPGTEFNSLFSSEILDNKNAPGEFADFAPCAGTVLASQLRPMDLKWWGRINDWRVFVANASHRLKSGSRARELIRFIPPHSYISEEKKKEQYRTVLFEIPLGKGRLWVCDLDLEASVGVDPVAQQFAVNLLQAAANPESTAKLPKLPSHEELLKGVTRK